MNPLVAVSLEDVHGQSDDREVAIDEVGISDLRLPVRIASCDGEIQMSVATAKVTVDLPADVRGTHMSRFVEALGGDLPVLSPDALKRFVLAVRGRLGS